MRTRFWNTLTVAGACLLASGASDAVAWTAEDANTRWSLSVPDGWYGGSYQQIRERVSSAEKTGEGEELHIQLLRALSRMARDADAVLLHLELSADGSHGDGATLTIRTDEAQAGQKGAFPPIEDLTTQTWSRLGERMMSSTEGAQGIKLVRHQEDIVVQGFRVATAGFIVKKPDGDRYEGVIVMYRPTSLYRPSSVTVFSLEAPVHVAGARLEEVWTMVRSIKFKE